ncbi:MAG: cyanophycinase [Peptococcaceae bacterium]|nr:cyanophycinase [Peptococcaceae bacterium]
MAKIMFIGGTEDREGECLILRRFLAEAGGDLARVAVITAATREGLRVGDDYRRVFQVLGCAWVDVVEINSREDAGRPEVSAILAEVTGVFLTGGDQVRLTGLLGGTTLENALKERVAAGCVLAGTSAGASALPALMIVGGETDTPDRDSIRMAPGFGFVPDIVADQHFAQRGRINRLLVAVAMNPRVLGIGIDEDTAACLSDGVFEVIGRGTVMVIDAAATRISNIQELSWGHPLTVSPVEIHLLSKGFCFSLLRRRII